MTKTRPVFAQRGAALLNVLLLICLAAVAGGGWFAWQEWQRWQQASAQREARIDELHASLAGLQAQREEQAAQLLALESRLTETGVAIDSLRQGGQRDWLVNEAAALARLAQQRLLLTADVEAADRLLTAADEVLARDADPAWLPARRALAADRQALDGARTLDVPGLVLRIAALQERVGALTVTGVTRTTQPVAEMDSGDWWQQMLARMPVQVRRYDSAVPLPLDEQQASLLRLTLNALLEQAQLSLLQGRAEVYRQALAQSRQILADWFAQDHAIARELDEAFKALEDTPVEQAIPEIGAGLRALELMQGDAP